MAILLPRQFIYVAVAFLVLVSCRKPVDTFPLPVDEMDYTDLNNRQIKYNSSSAVIDLNKDNEPDLIFSVLSVGDPVNQVDKRQFRVGSGIYTKLPVNNIEQVPVLSRTDTVFISDFNGYSWWEISSIILIERTENSAGVITWGGNWKTAAKNYLPVQVIKNEQRFNGWVELTADIANERIILHRTAISKHPEKNIRAGM